MKLRCKLCKHEVTVRGDNANAHDSAVVAEFASYLSALKPAACVHDFERIDGKAEA